MLKRTSVIRGRSSSNTLLALALAIGAGIALAACGGGSKSPTPGGTVAGQTRSATGGAGSSQPGTEEFGMTETQLVTSIERGETLIASCMASAGFKYVAIDAVTFREAMKAFGTARKLSDQEFVSQYGYGITTRPRAADFGIGLQNAAALNSLSASDQVAYKRTLLGDDRKATFVFALEHEDFSTVGGCTKTAIAKVYTPEQLKDTYTNPVDARIEADPRVVAARLKWSSCMRKAGYDYEHPDDIETELAQQLAKLTEGADPATLTGRSKDALTELQGRERAVALADRDCLAQFVDDVVREVERDIFGRNPS